MIAERKMHDRETPRLKSRLKIRRPVRKTAAGGTALRWQHNKTATILHFQLLPLQRQPGYNSIGYRYRIFAAPATTLSRFYFLPLLLAELQRRHRLGLLIQVILMPVHSARTGLDSRSRTAVLEPV